MSTSSSVIVRNFGIWQTQPTQENRDLLINSLVERFRKLATRQLWRDDRLRHVLESNDLFQNFALRLLKRLEAKPFEPELDFLRFASVLMRRELVDLARHHFGRRGRGEPPGFLDASQVAESDLSPSEKVATGETIASIYASVDTFDPKDRDLFDLLHIQELTQSEAANHLGVSQSQVSRMWTKITQRLGKRLRESLE